MKHLKILIFLSTFSLGNVLANDVKPPTLRAVMAGLATAMADLDRGIFYEDFKLIAKGAQNVAEHPKPAKQLPIVVKTLGKRMAKFKSFDGKVHNSAAEIVKLAKKKDMNGILKRHRVIVTNCVACHNQFRKEISSALK